MAATPKGDVYFGGGVGASPSTALGDFSNPGNIDGFISKVQAGHHYGQDHNALLWNVSLATPGVDWVLGVDAPDDGYVYACGITEGDLGGVPSNGSYDAFVTKLDAKTGTVLWMKLLGSAFPDGATGISVTEKSEIYITGITFGNLTGVDGPALGASDGFVAKYASNGDLLWVTMIQSEGQDKAYAIATTQKHVFVGGSTDWNLNGEMGSGNGDGFLACLDSAGSFVWTRLIGTPEADTVRSLSSLRHGVLVGGWTAGNLNGEVNRGPSGAFDGFITMFSSDGKEVGTSLVASTNKTDEVWGVTSRFGEIYACGYTQGDLDGQSNQGGPIFSPGDGFIKKFHPSELIPRWRPRRLKQTPAGTLTQKEPAVAPVVCCSDKEYVFGRPRGDSFCGK